MQKTYAGLLKWRVVDKTFQGLTDEEVELFNKTLGDLTGDAVEIGCLDGFSTAAILEAAPNLNLTSIDPFIPDSMEASLIGSEERWLENTRRFRDRVHLIRDYSQNVAKTWKSTNSFVFIDGDHTYPAVFQDYTDWAFHLKPGAVLAIHDSRKYRGGPAWHEGPSQVATKLIFGQPAVWEILGEEFSLTVAKKLI